MKKNNRSKTNGTQENQNTEAKLIAAATKLFAQKGFSNTSVREIAKAANINYAAINYHFESKENLYRAVINQVKEEGISRLSQVLKEPRTKDEFIVRLQVCLENTLEHFTEHHEVMQMVMRDVAMMGDKFFDMFTRDFRGLGEILADYLEVAKKKRFIRKDVDIRVVTLLMIQGILAPIQNPMLRKIFPHIGDPKRYKKHIGEVIGIVLAGIEEVKR